MASDGSVDDVDLRDGRSLGLLLGLGFDRGAALLSRRRRRLRHRRAGLRDVEDVVKQLRMVDPCGYGGRRMRVRAKLGSLAGLWSLLVWSAVICHLEVERRRRPLCLWLLLREALPSVMRPLLARYVETPMTPPMTSTAPMNRRLRR